MGLFQQVCQPDKLYNKLTICSDSIRETGLIPKVWVYFSQVLTILSGLPDLLVRYANGLGHEGVVGHLGVVEHPDGLQVRGQHQ